jgi:hypothetical protein
MNAPARSYRFTALRAWHAETGAGRIVAVFFVLQLPVRLVYSRPQIEAAGKQRIGDGAAKRPCGESRAKR